MSRAAEFFRRIRGWGRIDPPRREDAPYLLLGVFLTFAAIGPMSEMVMTRPHNTGGLLLGALIAGGIATSYAVVGIYRVFWVVPLILGFQLWGGNFLFSASVRGGLVWRAEPEDVEMAKTVAILAAVSSIAIGHMLLITFARRIGRVASDTQAQLAIAAEMHRSIVPPIDLCIGPVRIVGRSEASSVMGGDLIDTVVHGHGVDVVLADVSGHGVKAGMVMAMLKASVRTVLGATPGRSGADFNGAGGPCDRPDLGQCTGELSRVLAELSEPSMFATFVVLRIFIPARELADAGQGGCQPLKVELCTAGHGPVMHYSAADKRWNEIDNDCLPLGISPDERFVVRDLALHTGDRIVIVTDGLTEAFGKSGAQFGNEGITAALTGAADTSPGSLCEGLISASRKHGPQIDDQSVIAIAV